LLLQAGFFMEQYREYFDENRNLWNQRTTIHKDSSFYDVESFLEGKSSLNEIERRELGDVSNRKILHLQCHFGMDSLSLQRMGANVTGVDLSDVAIDEAKRLNNELSLDAKFICCNIYDLKDHLDDQFDIIFTSYGVIGWLPNLDTWAKIITDF